LTSHFAAKSGETLTVRSPALPPQQALGAERDLVERLADHREILASGRGDHEPICGTSWLATCCNSSPAN
jgi:hypothetical protein